MIMKGDIKIKSSTPSSFGSKMRKRLSDITNLHSQHKSPFKNSLPPVVVDDHHSSTQSYIDKLVKENAVMVKLIEEKDKIIESNGIEVQKLRVNLRTTQLQNWHLAQNNSQMLAELNIAKDRLKTLQHELVGRDVLFKVMTVELKEKAKLTCETNSIQEGETKSEETAVEQLPENNVNKNKTSKPKRGRSARSQSMGPTTSRQTVDKEAVESKRRCLRRQSVRFKPPDKHDDLFEIEVSNKLVDVTSQSTPCKSTKSTDAPRLLESKSTTAQRSSIGRPLRRVTEKVVTYKETPLNTKMRRPE